jgi:transposase
VLHCVENTGLYTNPLRLASQTAGEQTAGGVPSEAQATASTPPPIIQLWCQDALQIKLSTGRQKDKTDMLDAERIARYAYRFADQARLYVPRPAALRKLKVAVQQRAKLVAIKKGLGVSYRELTAFALAPVDPELEHIMQAQLDSLTQHIAALDRHLLTLITANEELQRQYRIAVSVPGIGAASAPVILALTGGFKEVPTARACASYAGISPHAHQSGTSIRRRGQTSKASNEQLKTAFHMGVISLLRTDNLWHQLYDRLRQKGRSNLTAINAMRNKTIRVLYACIKNDVMYDKNLHVNLQVS